METLKFKVEMHCASCASLIDKKLKKAGFESKSNPTLNITKISCEDNKSNEEKIIDLIKEIGYEAKRTN